MSHPPSPTDPFRIPLQLGAGMATPPTPKPVPPATSWFDVSNWQSFLKDMGFLGAGYPTNMFDSPTQMATKNFQSSADFGPVLPSSGIVSKPTYDKAVANGMPAYPIVNA